MSVYSTKQPFRSTTYYLFGFQELSRIICPFRSLHTNVLARAPFAQALFPRSTRGLLDLTSSSATPDTSLLHPPVQPPKHTRPTWCMRVKNSSFRSWCFMRQLHCPPFSDLVLAIWDSISRPLVRRVRVPVYRYSSATANRAEQPMSQSFSLTRLALPFFGRH